MANPPVLPSPTSLVDLAPELLDLVLSFLAPRDLTSFGQTCRLAHHFIRPTNQALWKQTFLRLFDHPKHVWHALVPTARAHNHPREALWDWHRELVRRMHACNLLLHHDKDALAPQIHHVVTTLLDIHQTASSTATAEAETHPPVSLNLMFLNRLVQRSPDFDALVHDFSRHPSSLCVPAYAQVTHHRPVTRSMLKRGAAAPDWASHFHIIYGPTGREQDSLASKAAARAIVYDWTVTNEDADHGPFLKDGSGAVNWQSVEAISSLMHRIFNTALKAYHLHPTGFDVHVPNKHPLDPAIPGDWAGLTGPWAGTYAFLDYRALVHYNFAHSLEHPLDLGNYEEACGELMRLDLEVDGSKKARNDRRLQSDLPHCDDLPKLYFKGTSTRQDNDQPSIDVRGMACLTPGGREVRWRFIISYAGADQWQLEGVQPSGIRSGGIYGLWSHVDHDDHGPMGPFYYAPCAITEFAFD